LIAVVPAMLERFGVPTTGCDAAALHLSSHKLLAKRWLRRHGIATPDWVAGADAPSLAGDTWIVKSVWEHASLGMDDGCVVNGSAAIRRRIEQSRRTFGGDWFAERFVDGREFNISILEIDGRPSVLPIAEIEFEDYAPGKPKIVGYAAKWLPDAVEDHATRRVFPVVPFELAARIREVATECWSIFGLSGYARVDMRLDAAGTPWILEINANPCLASDAGFCAAAEAGGLDFGTMIDLIVRAAGRRQ
jgi:D-alanine-D-alanine ligase